MHHHFEDRTPQHLGSNPNLDPNNANQQADIWGNPAQTGTPMKHMEGKLVYYRTIFILF